MNEVTINIRPIVIPITVGQLENILDDFHHSETAKQVMHATLVTLFSMATLGDIDGASLNIVYEKIVEVMRSTKEQK